MEEFFRLSPEEAGTKLSELANKLSAVLEQDPSLFQRTVYDLLKSIVGEISQLRSGTGSGAGQPAEVVWPVFTVPYPRHNCFKGRDDVLTELRRSLVEGKKTALTQVIRCNGRPRISDTR